MGTKLTADRVFTTDQIKLIIKSIEREIELCTKCNGLRGGGGVCRFVLDKYIFLIGYGTGLRCQELASLRWFDIHQDYLIVRRGKGGKRRNVFFGERVNNMFKDLHTIMKPDSNEWPLFRNRDGAALHRVTISKKCTYWIRRLGFTGSLTAHSLRHAHATMLLDSGVPLTGVAAQLGHSNCKITADTYLHLSAEATEKIKSVL